MTATRAKLPPSGSQAAIKLHIGGLGLCGDGYPNAARTVDLLRTRENVDVVECGGWLPEDFHLWKLTRMPRWRALGWISMLVFRNLYSLLRVVVRSLRNPGLMYIPYPSVFFMLWASLIPRRWRPKCIVDAYISIWDSMFQDRRAAKSVGVAERLVKVGERRALRAAAVVLVDTEANREYLISTFALDRNCVISLPLAIEQELFLHHQRSLDNQQPRRVRVLFVGTLIPLHGIGTILNAVRILRADERFEFRLIGDGQDAEKVAQFMRSSDSNAITWIREWCPLPRIASEIADADICLGVFGGDAKAGRVLPFKLYMYLAAGKPIVSQSLLSVPIDVPPPPFEAVTAGDGAGLADALLKLAAAPELRRDMGYAAHQYFCRWLSNVQVMEHWLNRIIPLARAHDE